MPPRLSHKVNYQSSTPSPYTRTSEPSLSFTISFSISHLSVRYTPN